jgi:hypothetical protein
VAAIRQTAQRGALALALRTPLEIVVGELGNEQDVLAQNNRLTPPGAGAKWSLPKFRSLSR